MQRVELPNGTTLLVKRIATSPTVVITMYGLGGVTAEDAKVNGLGDSSTAILPLLTQDRSAAAT